MKKILITTESLTMGGVEKSLISFIKFLKKFDTEIDLYVLNEGKLKNEMQSLTNINIIPIKISKKKWLNRIKKSIFCKSLYKKFQQNHYKDYDISIAYYGLNNYSDIYAASANAKKKFIWIHNNFEELYNNSNKKLLLKIRNIFLKKKFGLFDEIIAVSKAAEIGFINTFPKYKEKVNTINNIFDISCLSKKNEEIEEKLIGKYKILYIGRLDKLKNVTKLITEFYKVFQVLKDSYLYIIGDGVEKENLQKKANELGISKNVIFLGIKENPYKYIDKCDIIATASMSEAYSTNMIEALALKKYIVSASNNGAKEIFYNINNANLNNAIICESDYIHNHIIFYIKNKNLFKPNFNITIANNKIEQELKTKLELVNKVENKNE